MKNYMIVIILLGFIAFAYADDNSPKLSTTGAPTSTNALWGQLGLGMSGGRTDFDRHNRDYINAEMSLHYRRIHNTYAIGFDGLAADCYGISSAWLTWGRSGNTIYTDSSIAVGLAIARWGHDTESDAGTIESAEKVGVVLRAESLLHAPHVLGIGLGAALLWSPEIRYWKISLNMALGSWAW